MQPLKPYNRMQMQLASNPVLSQPPLAAMQQLSEKPHLGFATKKTAWNPGPNVCNFTVTLGLQVAMVENGVRKTYSARYYNPATGRFLSRDPEDGISNNPATLHKYLYVGGDPVNGIDPLGWEDIIEYKAQSKASGLQSHHIIEQRFAKTLGAFYCTISAVLTIEEHQAVTNAWRRAIPYGAGGTGVATIAEVFSVAEQIYANAPNMLAAAQKCQALAGL
jgi:RHS repeat-associated protein